MVTEEDRQASNDGHDYGVDCVLIVGAASSVPAVRRRCRKPSVPRRRTSGLEIEHTRRQRERCDDHLERMTGTKSPMGLEELRQHFRFDNFGISAAGPRKPMNVFVAAGRIIETLSQNFVGPLLVNERCGVSPEDFTCPSHTRISNFHGLTVNSVHTSRPSCAVLSYQRHCRAPQRHLAQRCSRMVEDKSYEIGARVDCDGYRGTLRYVGPVGDTKGTWLGVDWDDPSRGKHNGTHQGTEYFKAWHPTSGSFVRPGKARFGISCAEAIKNRYGLIDDDLAGIDRASLTSLKKEMKAPFVEMVGFSKVNRKQSKFDQLKIVSLREQCVSSAGGPGELGDLCPNIQEFDVSRNLINSWRVIGEICRELPRLERLDVSENVLPSEEDRTAVTLDETFPNIRYLTMSRMNYDWASVQRCTFMFPGLQELSISFNLVSRLESPSGDSNINGITSLTLEGNLVSSWDEILKLGALPRLEYLNLNSNGIEAIRFPCNEDTGKTYMFAGLRQLHLSHNAISEWRSVSELEKLANLEDLKFRDNPVLKGVSVETARQLIIAKIAKLKFLNGVEIDCSERKGAEYDYLKLFGPQWLQTADSSGPNNAIERRKEFIENHPRYPFLVEKYGGPEAVAPKANVSMVSDVITVEFLCPNDPVQTKMITRKLLKDMDVQKVTGLAQRIFRTGGKIPTLSFVRRDLSKDEIPLDKPLQQLSYYSIQDGDRVLVRW